MENSEQSKKRNFNWISTLISIAALCISILALRYQWNEGKTEKIITASMLLDESRDILSQKEGSQWIEINAHLPVTLEEIKRIEIARRKIWQALLLDPDACDAYGQMAYLFVRQGMLDSALHYVNRRIELCRTYDLRAFILSLQFKTEEAEKYFKKDLAQFPTDPQRYLNMARFYYGSYNDSLFKIYLDSAKLIGSNRGWDPNLIKLDTGSTRQRKF